MADIGIPAPPPIRWNVGGKEVIASGTILLPGTTSCSVSIGPVTIEFVFVEREGSAAQMEFESITPLIARANLVNFGSTLGNALTEYTQIAGVKGRAIEACLSVHRMGEKRPVRLLAYTFVWGDMMP